MMQANPLEILNEEDRILRESETNEMLLLELDKIDKNSHSSINSSMIADEQLP